MPTITETERLILRKIKFSDANDLFEMDADPLVHQYIENKPVTDISEITQVIELIQKQYAAYGIARWAVVTKENNECIGWAGLKYFTTVLNNHTDFYELGYRFKRKHWGKGYATESSKAVLNYAFTRLGVDSVYAITDPGNLNSKKVLSKLGFDFRETFDYDGSDTDWFALKKASWVRNNPIAG